MCESNCQAQALQAPFVIQLVPAFPHHPPFAATYYGGYRVVMGHEAARTQDLQAAARFATAEAAAQVRSQLLPTISCVWAVVDLREPRRAEDLLPQDVAQALAHGLPLTVDHDTGRPAAR